MLRLKNVEIENFIAFEDTVSIPLDKRGIVVITGYNKDSLSSKTNGAGKSTIIEAIVWALYNKTIRKSSVDDIIPIYSKKKYARVSLDFFVNGNDVKVTRYRNHPEFKSELELFINGQTESVDSQDKKDLQSKLQNIIGIDYITFLNTVLFIGGEDLFSEMSDSKQKEILDKTLGLDRFKTGETNSKEEYKKLKSRIEEVERDLENLHNRKEIVTKDINDYKIGNAEFISKKVKALDELTKNLASIEQEIEKTTKTYIESVTKLNTFTKELQEVEKEAINTKRIELEIATKERESYQMQAEINNYSDELQQYVGMDIIFNDYSGVSVEKIIKNITEVKAQIITHKREKERLQLKINSLKEKVCTECGTEITEQIITNSKRKIEEEVKKLDSTLEELISNLADMENTQKVLIEYAEHNKKIERKKYLEDKLLKLQTDLASIELNITNLKMVIEGRNTNSYEALKKEVKHLTEIVSFNKKIVTDKEDSKLRIVNEIETKEKEDNIYAVLLADRKSELSALEDKIAINNSTLETLREELKYVEFWYKGYSNYNKDQTPLRMFIYHRAIDIMNLEVKRFTSILTGSDIEVKFTTNKELQSGETRDKLGISVVNKIGAKNYAMQSTGEKERVNIAILMALQSVSRYLSPVKVDFMAFDDFDRGIDEEGINFFVKMLLEVSKYIGTIFIATKREDLIKQIENRIVVIRENKKSVIQ